MYQVAGLDMCHLYLKTGLCQQLPESFEIKDIPFVPSRPLASKPGLAIDPSDLKTRIFVMV